MSKVTQREIDEAFEEEREIEKEILNNDDSNDGLTEENFEAFKRWYYELY